MKVVILGATGMLGHAVARHFDSLYGPDNVVRSCRDSAALNGAHDRWISLKLPIYDINGLSSIPADADYVINCIGTIKPFIEKTSVVETLAVNAIFPHFLAEHCNNNKSRLIHITTDCVYSGLEIEPYLESHPHDATDLYGRTKSLGEPADAMVLRTSIIGNEIQNKVSLVEWVKSQAGNEVSGYTNHLWNGVTTPTYAFICEKIMEEGLFEKGVFHIFSPETVTKCDLVIMISDALDLKVKVKPFETEVPCYRNLGSTFALAGKLGIPSLSTQVAEL
jgi:dTDP-4-dehydrorhamnose reductase